MTHANAVTSIAILTVMVLGLPTGIYANNLQVVHELKGTPSAALTFGQKRARQHFNDGWVGLSQYYDYELDSCMVPADADERGERYSEYLLTHHGFGIHGRCAIIGWTSNGRDARFVEETRYGKWFVTGYNLEKLNLIDEDIKRIRASLTLDNKLSRWRPPEPERAPRHLRYDGGN